MSESPLPEKHCYLVVGGELEYVHQEHFRDLSEVKILGPYADREDAKKAWRGASQRDVDNAHMRYRIVKVY